MVIYSTIVCISYPGDEEQYKERLKNDSDQKLIQHHQTAYKIKQNDIYSSKVHIYTVLYHMKAYKCLEFKHSHTNNKNPHFVLYNL